MPRVKDIYDFINEIAPFSQQEQWDNSGMLVGDFEKEVGCAAVVLDVTEDAVNQAKNLGAELIISHHPVIFKAQKNILKGNIVYDLIRNDISVISAHTCLDSADGGVSDVLAETLELSSIFSVPSSDCCVPMLRIGTLGGGMTADEFASYVKKHIKCGFLRYVKGRTPINKVAVCGGAGGSLLRDVIDAGADAYVTGDVGHHDFLDAAANEITMIGAGHFNTEDLVIEPLAKRISARFPNIRVERLKEDDPISYL